MFTSSGTPATQALIGSLLAALHPKPQTAKTLQEARSRFLVVVVEDDELVQTEVPSQGGSLFIERDHGAQVLQRARERIFRD